MPDTEQIIRQWYATRLAQVTDELAATVAALQQAQAELANVRAELHNATVTPPLGDTTTPGD